MGSKNERHEEKWGEKVTFLLIFLSYFPLVPSPLNPAGGGDLTKIYYKTQPPHEFCAPYHSTAAVTVSRWLCCPFSHSKILSNNHKKVKVSLHHHFSVVELWEHPILLDFTMQVQLVKNTPKTWKMAEPIGSCWSNLPWHLTKATYEGSGAHCAWLCIILFF